MFLMRRLANLIYYHFTSKKDRTKRRRRWKHEETNKCTSPLRSQMPTYVETGTDELIPHSVRGRRTRDKVQILDHWYMNLALPPLFLTLSLAELHPACFTLFWTFWWQDRSRRATDADWTGGGRCNIFPSDQRWSGRRYVYSICQTHGNYCGSLRRTRSGQARGGEEKKKMKDHFD
jgi:hypothetical protein